MFQRRYTNDRKGERMRTQATGSCKTARGFQWDIKIDDLSVGGCRVDDPRHGMELGAHVTLFIAGTGPHIAEVAWRQGDRVGLEFARPLPERVVKHIAAGEWEQAKEAQSAVVTQFPVRRLI
jgi:hypothetical protein